MLQDFYISKQKGENVNKKCWIINELKELKKKAILNHKKYLSFSFIIIIILFIYIKVYTMYFIFKANFFTRKTIKNIFIVFTTRTT